MPVVDRIAGPGIGPNDISMDLPDCVRFNTDQDRAAFGAFADTIVRHALQHAVDTLRGMMGELDGHYSKDQIADKFKEKLGV